MIAFFVVILSCFHRVFGYKSEMLADNVCSMPYS